mmetsp:Transcript_34333/g.75170  ORF Transcript_34333/g.75170 Transcript_34333/m.75170 type:complete len:200 (+) Transcript_34333:303-902(+)
MRLDYFAAMDVDEYIRIDSSKSAPDYDRHSAFRSSLEAFGPGLSVSDVDTLPKYLDAFRNKRSDKYVGIRMNSIFFGRGPNATTDPSLDIDYDWRQRGDPGSFPFTRYKLLLNVSCNDYVNIHYQMGNPSCPLKKLWNSNANDLRFNHYKLPRNGVYWKSQRKVRPPEDVVRDASLVDEYRERLVGEILLGEEQSLQSA